MKLLFFLYLILIFLAGFACKEPSTGFDTPPVSLTADVGATDSYLQVSTSWIYSNDSLELSRDNQIIYRSAISSQETFLFLDSLTPNHTYNVTARIISASSGKPLPRTSIVFTTLDTTSHEFTWQLDTLGADYSSSILRDVVILNDTTIYGVGELSKRDSLGQVEFQHYGVVKITPQSQSFLRVFAMGPTGTRSNVRPQGIIPISEIELWLAYGGVVRWNPFYSFGEGYWLNSFPGNPSPIWSTGQAAQKLLHTSEGHLYVVGTGGAIAYFNRVLWQNVPSGTSLPFQDICNLNSDQAVAVASNLYLNEGKRILLLDQLSVSILPDSGLPWSLSGVTSTSPNRVMIAGAGVFWKRGALADENTPWIPAFGRELTPHYLRDVEGNAKNDVFAVGDYGEVLHYNGVSWRSFRTETGLPSGSYFRVAMRGNLVVAVGIGPTTQEAIVLRGRRL